MKQLAIVIPVHNDEPFLERCLDSIPVSEDIQVIIIDDGSTDRSGDICDKYAENFTVYHTNHCGGAAAARNVGLAMVDAEWVAFLDADDMLVEDYEKVIFAGIEHAKKHDVNVVQFNHKRHYTKIDKTVKKYANPEGLYTFKEMLDIRFWNAVWNKIYRYEIIAECDAYFPEHLVCGEDEAFNLQILFNIGKVWHEDACNFIRFFDNPNSIMHTITKEDTQRLIDYLYILVYETDDKTKEEILMTRIEYLEGMIDA